MKTSVRMRLLKIVFAAAVVASLSGCYAHGGIGVYSVANMPTISAITA